MAAAAITRWGQNLGTGDARANFLKIFSRRVLAPFSRKTITMGRVFTQTITEGESAQFPLIGAASASYMTPGEDIIDDGYLSQPKASEKVIVIDGVMVSASLLARIDRLMSHWEVSSKVARELGWSLAKNFDLNTLQTIFNGSEKSATISGDDSDWGKGGVQLLDADFHTSATSAVATLRELAERFDNNEVPDEGRHVIVDPATHRRLAEHSTLVSKDYNANTGGDIGTGSLVQVQGFHVHKTTQLARLRTQGLAGDGNFTSGDLAGEQRGTDYLGKFTNCRAIAWQEDMSVGVVKLDDFAIETERILRKLSTLMVAGFSCGHGVLHESACASVISASDAA